MISFVFGFLIINEVEKYISVFHQTLHSFIEAAGIKGLQYQENK